MDCALPYYLDIVDFLPDATFVVDSRRRIVAWNKALEELTGIKKDTLIGAGDYAYAVPFYGERRPVLIDFVFWEDRKNEIHYKLVERKNSHIFGEAFSPHLYGGKGAHLAGTAAPILDDKGNLIGAIQSIRDITRCAQTENELRLSEERFSRAFRASPNMMSISYLDDHAIIDVNDVFLQTVGHSREEVIGKKITDLGLWLDPAERDRIVAGIDENAGIRNIEIVFRDKSGGDRHGLFSAEIIEIHGRKCLLGIINDVTDRVHCDREMARLDRLYLVGEMAATIAHEIRNPLTNILGFTEILKTESKDAANSSYFDYIIEELHHANSIVEEFLFLARSKPLVLKKQNINDILQAIAPLIKASSVHDKKSVEFELNEIKNIPLDEKEIRQLVLNLARNGLEAMPPGGVLTIRTFMNHQDVVLEVIDRGPGIPPEALDKLGTPFFTTKENGTGLGLAVCYNIADRHKAEIKVKTGRQGTTFFIIFKQA